MHLRADPRCSCAADGEPAGGGVPAPRFSDPRAGCRSAQDRIFIPSFSQAPGSFGAADGGTVGGSAYGSVLFFFAQACGAERGLVAVGLVGEVFKVYAQDRFLFYCFILSLTWSDEAFTQVFPLYPKIKVRGWVRTGGSELGADFTPWTPPAHLARHSLEEVAAESKVAVTAVASNKKARATSEGQSADRMKLAKEIDDPDIGQPTAECQLMTPSERRLVTQGCEL